MGTFVNGESGSSVRTKINAAIEKTEGTAAITAIDVDGGAIDGVTLGTNSAVTEAQVDNININGNTISSTDTNGDITIDPNGAGDVNIGNFKFDADQTIGAGQDNYVLTYDNTGGKISLEAAPGAGGGISNVVEDTTPQLGGNLDVNGNALVSVSNGTIDLDPNGFGQVTFKGNLTRGAGNFVLNCEQNTHGITIQGPPHSAAANYTLTLPNTDGSSAQVLQTNGSGTLSWTNQITELVNDLTPQLGGNLDVNSNSIVSISNGNIAITPDGTGSIVLDGVNWPQADGSANQFLKTNGAGQLSYESVVSNATHTGEVTGDTVLTIADNVVDEANLKVSNAPTDGYVLVARSANTGGLTWESVSGASGLSNVVEDTTPQLGGNLDLNSNNITGTGDITPTGDIKPTTYQETVGTESSGTLDLSTGNVFSHAPSANVTYVFSNPPSTGTAFGFTLKVSPSATITQTWPASVDWAGGSAPTATASGETDVFAFYTQDGGTTYYGFQAGDAMA